MKTRKNHTDPYGKLEWCIGTPDDFWCFDFHDFGNGWIQLCAICNSETGHFIQDEECVTVPSSQAVDVAKRMTDDALDWLAPDLEHDEDGWNQDPTYFWRSVHCHVTKTGSAIRRPVRMNYAQINTANYL